MKKINIFILAAGLGERLRPITYHIPKPLIPVLGKPLLQYIIENVSALPLIKIGVNTHYKKELLERWIAECSFKEKIILFPEETIQGTGGALKNAERLLNKGVFLAHNSDILTDINLEKLLEYHCLSENLVTLAVHDYPEFNSLIIDESGFLIRIKKRHGHSLDDRRTLAFTGIAIYEPEFLKFLPSGISNVVDAWINAISAGYKIGTFNVSGCYWRDIGTPSAYTSAVFDTLKAEGETVYIHPSIKKCNDIDLQGYVVVEKGCRLDKGVALRNCIILPGASIERKRGEEDDYSEREMRGLLFKNCIIGQGFKIDLNESDILGLSAKDQRKLIGTGGSNRKYYRVRENNRAFVLMQCNGHDRDFERHIEYTHFFLKHSIPVPELIKVESDKMQAVFEDVGDISLYSYLKCPREKKEVEDIYKQVIHVMALIHTVATDHVQECPLLQKRVFDYEYFRWETDYFIKRFVKEIRNMKVKCVSELEKELHYLALKADSFLKTVIHRDMQSQNIMVMKGRKIKLIDYQGARIGPPAYDVASILWDPYCRLDDNIRARLLDFYIIQMKNKRGIRFNESYFRNTLLSCRLQRHMQALGAYGFLSSVKGKKYFLKYVPEGLRLLKEDISLAKNQYPQLYRLIISL